MVFWLGLRGVPSASLGAILAALTSPSLSQFDSWWDGSRPDECVCTAEAIYIPSEFIFVTPLPCFCSVLLQYLLHIYLPVTSQLLYFCLIIHLGCNSHSLGAAPSSFLLGSTFWPQVSCFKVIVRLKVLHSRILMLMQLRLFISSHQASFAWLVGSEPISAILAMTIEQGWQQFTLDIQMTGMWDATNNITLFPLWTDGGSL